jgi:hypothetical protein
MGALPPLLFLLFSFLFTSWQAWRGWLLYARGGPYRVHLKPGPERWLGLYAADELKKGEIAAAGWVALWAAWERRCALEPGGELVGLRLASPLRAPGRHRPGPDHSRAGAAAGRLSRRPSAPRGAAEAPRGSPRFQRFFP